jgi:hypothetical protein
MTRYEVVRHPHSPEHLLFKVTHRGRVYASTCAWEPGEDNPVPNAQTVEYSWKHGRHQFLPYDESRGCYLS